jgi:hypothetical protein
MSGDVAFPQRVPTTRSTHMCAVGDMFVVSELGVCMFSCAEEPRAGSVDEGLLSEERLVVVMRKDARVCRIPTWYTLPRPRCLRIVGCFDYDSVDGSMVSIVDSGKKRMIRDMAICGESVEFFLWLAREAEGAKIEYFPF